MLSNRRKPTLAWKECETCRSSKQYRSLHDAVQHVQVQHYGVFEVENIVIDTETLGLWLRSDNQNYADHRLELYTHYLELLIVPLREVYKTGRNIWDGVASDKNSMPSRVMLPKAIVNAFEDAILLVICAAKLFPFVNRCSDPMNQYMKNAASKIQKDREVLESTGKELFHIGNSVKSHMNKAEQDVMLMAYTDTGAETVSYDAVGSEYILATIMTSLLNRPLSKEGTIDIIYSKFYRRLVSRFIYIDMNSFTDT